MNHGERSRSGSDSDNYKNKGFFAVLKKKMKNKNNPDKMKSKTKETKSEPVNTELPLSNNQVLDQPAEKEVSTEVSVSSLDAVETSSTTLTEKLNIGLCFQPETEEKNERDEEMDAFFKKDYYGLSEATDSQGNDDVLYPPRLIPEQNRRSEASTSQPPVDPKNSTTVEELLSHRCRYQPVEEIDNISPDALAVKLWILLQIYDDNFPPVLPMMSLRQTVLFSKLQEIFEDQPLPLQLYPPQGFRNFVSLLWISSSFDLVPPGVVPNDLKALNDMLKNKQIRAFQIGTSICEAMETWTTEMKGEYGSHFKIFDGLNANAESLLNGQQCSNPVDFISTMQFVAISSDFIKTVGFDSRFLSNLQPKLGVPQSNNIPYYHLSISLNYQTIGEIARQFWTEAGRYDHSILNTANAKSWNWKLCEWDWLIESVKRKPRKIVGLWQKNEIVAEKIRKKAEQEELMMAMLRNTEMPAVVEWDSIKEASGEVRTFGFVENEPTEHFTYSYSNIDSTEAYFSDEGADSSGDDASLASSDCAMSRHGSSITVYSTESESSLHSYRPSPDQISLTSANSGDLVDPGF